jgi:type I restriction enzyme R subunit
MQHLLKDDTQVYKQFVENESFRRFVGDMVYQITSQASDVGSEVPFS